MNKLIVVGVVIFLIGFCTYKQSFNDQVVEFTVISKERVNSKESSSYLIFTTKGTYTCEDTWMRGKFSSSDMYGGIIPKTKYRATVVGWRIPFFSSYKNIIEIEKVGKEKVKKKELIFVPTNDKFQEERSFSYE